MTKAEAIEEIRKRICCEKPVAHFCNDSCMYGEGQCPIDMAIQALKKEEE